MITEYNFNFQYLRLKDNVIEDVKQTIKLPSFMGQDEIWRTAYSFGLVLTQQGRKMIAISLTGECTI